MLYTLLMALFSIQSSLTGELPKDQLKYQSKTAGYSILLPREWRTTADKKIYTPDGKPILVDLWANEPERFLSMEIIVNHAVAEENANIERQPQLKSISQFLNNYKVEESSNITIDGLPAIHHIISYHDSIDFSKIQYVVTSNRQVYEITFTMPASTLEQNKPYIETIMKSLHFERHEK